MLEFQVVSMYLLENHIKPPSEACWAASCISDATVPRTSLSSLIRIFNALINKSCSMSLLGSSLASVLICSQNLHQYKAWRENIMETHHISETSLAPEFAKEYDFDCAS